MLAYLHIRFKLVSTALYKSLLLGLMVCASPFIGQAQVELNQNTVSNGAGFVSGGSYSGYVSVGQMATYMFANGSQIATQGIILNEISGDVEFTFELSGNLTENTETKSGSLRLKSSAALLVGEPLAFATVYLMLVETGDVYASTTTDSLGHFSFTNVPYLNFYFVLHDPIIPIEPVVLNFVESNVFVKEVEINGEVGKEGITTEVVITTQASTGSKEESKSMYVDNDNDGFGYGSITYRLNSSASEDGYSDSNDDCDDEDPSINPDAVDIPGSGIDANCDGLYLWYEDLDNNGLGTSVIVPSPNDQVGNGLANNDYETNEGKIVECANIELTLNNLGFAEISAGDIVVDDDDNNVGVIGEPFVATPSSFDCSNVDSTRKASLVITNLENEQFYCVVDVKVNGTVPNVSVSESELPEFCQGQFILLSAESEDAVSYSWSTGSDSNIAEISTNGKFDVIVTSNTGCIADTSYIINGYEVSELLSAYTILATDEVHLHNSNIVASGGMGVSKEGKKAKLHEASHVVDFVRASQIEISTGSTLGTPIYSSATINVPRFVKNTKSNRNSKSIKAKRNKHTTLGDEVYRKVEIEEGASVMFEASEIYIEELIVKKGAIVEFMNCANLYIKKPLKIEENCQFNTMENKVVIYVEDKVEVGKGSAINASIHADDNEIKVKGDEKNPTTMNGMFIGKKIHGDKKVIWNMNPICDPCGNAELDNINEPIGKSAEFSAEVPVINDSIDFKVYPNPTTGIVNMQFNNIENKEFKVSVLNMIGQKIYERNYLEQDHIEIDLTGKSPGMYFVKYMEGKTVITKKVILKRK